MTMNKVDDNLRTPTESITLTSRFALVAFCLVAGLSYRVIVGLLPPSIFQLGVLLGLSAIFLLIAGFAKREQSLNKYWEIPYAFFIFALAGILGDSHSFGSVQQAYVLNVLHETPSANNPIASTVLGTVLGQLVATIAIIVPIILLTKASGRDLSSIFIDRTRLKNGLVVSIVGFLVFYLLAAFGFSARLFPNNGVTLSGFIALTPAILVIVLCNGLREELWFRGLFLKKYGKFLSPFTSNLLAAIIFASFHVQIQYTPSLAFFLGIALVLGLFFGYLMQRTGNLFAAAIFHAGSDIPIFLVYLSYSLR